MISNKKEMKLRILHTLLVILGNVILAFGVAVFLVPYNIVSGGIASIALIFQGAFGWNINVSLIVITWTFYILGAVLLGKKFAVQTIIATIVYPLAFSLFLSLQQQTPILHLDVTNSVNLLLASIFGGSLTGIGVAITFLGGGSTGGVDIIALILQKYFNFKCSIVSFIVDAITILCGFFTYNDLSLALIGIICAALAAMFVDKIFFGTGNFYIAYIISPKWKEINEFILAKLERGTTLVDSIGGYSGEDKKMIQVSFSASEYVILQEAISSIDSKAFMSIIKAHEVKGEGFNPYIKHKKSRLLKTQKEDDDYGNKEREN